jgi:hypothetical protein
MLDFRSEERIRPDVLVCSIRAKLRRHEALDTGRERGVQKGVLCLHCGWYVSQTRHYGVLVAKRSSKSIFVVVVDFYDVYCVGDRNCLSTARECLHSKTSCVERLDDRWSDGTCYL